MKGLLLKMLRNQKFYRIIKPLINLYLLKEKNPPFRIWVSFLCELLRDAYGKRRPLVFINAFFPSELIFGLKATPFIPEIYASLVAYFDLSRHPIEIGGEIISRDQCSFFRCVAGLAEKKILPEPDLIISSSQLCDGATKFFSELAEFYKVPHLYLDLPQGPKEKAKVYVMEQLKEIASSASKLLRLPLKEEYLSEALQKSRLCWHLIREINELRKRRPSPFPGSEALSYVNGMTFHSMGSEKGLFFFRALKSYIEKRVEKKEGYLKEEKSRILWLHHIRPYYPNPIFSFLDRHGIAIAFEEASYLFWPEPNPSRPFESLTQKLLSNPWADTIERRLELVREIAIEYEVQGAIHFSHFGCRQSTGGSSMIGEELKELGLKYLILPGDGADPDNYSVGQTLTRLQAFKELLERKE